MKITRRILQEIIKEEFNASGKSLLAICFAALAMVASACNVDVNYNERRMPAKQCLYKLRKLKRQGRFRPGSRPDRVAKRVEKALILSIKEENEGGSMAKIGKAVAEQACTRLVNHYGK